jgi:hypothetical protein
MTCDKQLQGVNLEAVRQKRDLDQALNTKEFAVLAGISYSLAREWFRMPGFPVVGSVVFWEDFVLWRRTRNQMKSQPDFSGSGDGVTDQIEFRSSPAKSPHHWPARAASILADLE